MAEMVLLSKHDLDEMLKKNESEKVNLKNQNLLKNSLEIIGIKDVSELSGYKNSTIRWKVSKNQMPCFQRGKPLLFRKSEILKWLNDGRKLNF